MEIKKIGVVGAGTMGAGIAQACAGGGFEVVVREVADEFLENGLARIRKGIDKWVEQIATDYTVAELSPVDRALCDYAAKLTATPGAMSEVDVIALRDSGLSDTAINDATQVIAYFNYINRIADGLGVDLEPDMPTS